MITCSLLSPMLDEGLKEEGGKAYVLHLVVIPLQDRFRDGI
jgi:hypothetical protein